MRRRWWPSSSPSSRRNSKWYGIGSQSAKSPTYGMNPTSRRNSATIGFISCAVTVPDGEMIAYVERNRLRPNTFWISPILPPSAPVTSYVAFGSNRCRALMRSSSVDFDSSV